MVGAQSSGRGSGIGIYGPSPASETDGETFDGETDFDDFEDWDYREMLSTMYVIRLPSHFEMKILPC